MYFRMDLENSHRRFMVSIALQCNKSMHCGGSECTHLLDSLNEYVLTART